MIATMMALAIPIPDWNSLDSVRLAHSVLELAALAFFALLVVFDVLAHQFDEDHPKRARRFEKVGLWCFAIAVLAEVAAYPYGQRNDTLSEHIIVSLSETSRLAAKDAGTALTDSGTAMTQAGIAEDAAGKATSKADKASATADKAGKSASGALDLAGNAKAEVATVQSNIARLDEKYAPRTLSKTKRDILIELLKKVRQKPRDVIEIEFSIAATDGGSYGKELADAISDPATGWKARAGNRSVTIGDEDKTGLLVVVHDSTHFSRWAAELLGALQIAGTGAEGGNDPRLSSDAAYILILKKN